MKKIISISISLIMAFTMFIPQLVLAEDGGDIVDVPTEDQVINEHNIDNDDNDENNNEEEQNSEPEVVNSNVQTDVNGLAKKNEHLIYSNFIIKDKITVTHVMGRKVYLERYEKGKWKVEKKYNAGNGDKSEKITIVFPKKVRTVKYRVRVPSKTIKTVINKGDKQVIKTVEYKGVTKSTKTVAKKFKWPIKNNKRISSDFGSRHCPFHGREFHPAVDIPARTGTKVIAAADGVVVKAGRVRSFGKRIIVKHGNKKTETWYNHLSSIKVKKGQKVKAGQVIGRVGSTGDSTGPHLDFRIYIKGKAKNPTKYAAR